ncbi:MAG: hypothetical protein ACXAEX_01500 [Promethearchaeota archaeon]|jgi:hypothetical protein
MSSESIDKKLHRFEDTVQEPEKLKLVIVPFSTFFIKQENFVYTGDEKIPFKKREVLYQTIMLREFTDET